MSLEPSGWGQTTAKPGRWLRLESPNFIVCSAIAQDKSRQEVEALERFHSLLLRLMPRGARPLAKLTVYIAATGKDFEHSAPTLSQFVGGFYQAGVEEIRAVVDVTDATGRQRNMSRNVRADDARVVLFHEYAHHYTRTNTRVAYPPWCQEGIAEFLSTVQVTDNGYTLGQFTLNRAQWLTMGGWMGVEDFLGKDPHTMSADETAQFYARSWLATHLLCTRPERAVGFDRYCKALQAGGDPLGSFEGAFGITLAAFDNEPKEYKRKSIGLWKMQEASPDISSSIYITSLDVAANQILMPLSHLRSLPSSEEARQSVDLIRAEAAKFPGNPFAIRANAWADVWYGDLGVARTNLDALLGIDPNTPDSIHLSGLCDLRAGYAADDAARIKKARSQFAHAHSIDNSRSGSLFRYVESHFNEAYEMTPHLLDVLVQAYNQTPQVDTIAIMAAQALMQHERYKEAAFVLRPMVGELHSGGRAQVAAELLSEAEAETVSGFTFFGSARSWDGT